MTTGHRHHLLVLRESSRLLRIGQYPLAKTRDRAKAERSRWVWRQVVGVIWPTEHGGQGLRTHDYPEFHLTPLGILHALTGLSVIVMPDDDEEIPG